ncbi:NACHT domain-containing protein [Sphingomonas cavernae]|uniref:NACHT C-terminal Alpha/Beta 2 domain-containing protein n=1 Tax=Sphingomonas cavernae TaxID=2320861 RepID=A0A418WKS1_9SPHN|nr:hypothetical protein [Sphingomonas cavernae]RJF90647.1 hypothetical protein D3876_10550 [Sphingomonas cavernae]
MDALSDDASDAVSTGRAASPEATGGVGTSYEHACIAAYLAALLTRSHAPGCPGIVTSVAVQQKALGRPLDDVVLEWEDDAGRCGTLDLQLKRSLAISKGEDTDFAQIVAEAWTTMKLPDFVDGRDLAGGLSEILAAANHYACQKLSDQARLEADPAAFTAAVADQMGLAERKAHETVKVILTRELGSAPTAEDMHFFWRNFVLGRLEATSDRGADRLRAIDQLRQVAPSDGANPTQIFAILEALAKQLNVRAVRLDSVQTVSLLRDRFGTRLAALPDQAVEALQAGRRGAEPELAAFRERDQAQLIDPVFGTRDAAKADAPERIVQLTEVEAELRAARSVILVGEPGAGKTSALQQIAVMLLVQPDIVPIVRSLPYLALRGDSIVSQLCGKGSFAALSEGGFATLANAAQLILLLDGWNELNPEQRQWAWAELDALRRDYPSMPLVIATRTGTAAPFSPAATLEVLPFDRDRQLDVAARLVGPAGHDLIGRARSVPTLRPLLRTPLFLAAILRQGASGTLPTDRETVIARLVAEAGGTPARREQLRVALDGQHRIFLQAIAEELMNAGTTFCPEETLLPTIAAVASNLRAQQFLTQPASPQTVLDLLVSHHLLVGIGAPGERTIGLQHQLIQEWFASFRVARMIESQQEGLINESLSKVINAPFWAVAVLFAVERVARSKAAAVPLRALILTTLGIEPFLAADMFRLSRECVGRSLDEAIIAFAERWKGEDSSRAIPFMLATGLGQFGATLWAALEKSGELAFDLHRTGRSFPISALESQWALRFPALKDQTRRVLLIDLVEQGDNASLALALRAAATDPSANVVAGVIDYLDFRDERTRLEGLLESLPDKMWVELARGREPECLTSAHRERWQSYRRDRFDHAEGFEWTHLALEFDCAPPTQIVNVALDLKTDNHWASHQLEEKLFARFPALFQSILLARLLNGDPLPYPVDAYLDGVEPAEQAQLLVIAKSKDENYYRRQIAAQLLGRDCVASLIDHMMGCAGDRGALRRPDTQEVRDVLRSVRLDLLITDVLSRPAQSAAQAAILASMLADWRGRDEERAFAIPIAHKDVLIERAQDWVALLLGSGDQLPRWDLAELARLIGRIGSEALLLPLMSLWDRDRTRQTAERAEYAVNPHGTRASEAFMGYDNQYRGAMLGIGGDAVIDAMTTRIDDPTFEHDAAIVLGQLLEIDPAPRGPMGPKLDDLGTRRARLIERRASPPHPIAAKIIDRIEALVAEGTADAITRAFQLAGPVTLMNYGDRGPALVALIEAGKDNGLLRDFCKAFSERGEALPAHIVRHGIAAAAVALAAMKWVHDNDYWRIEDWFRLIAFSDDVRAVLPVFDELPVEMRRQYRLRNLVFAIGHSISPTAVGALIELIQRSPELIRDGWPEAMTRIGSAEAANALFDAVIGAPEDPKTWRDSFALRTALATALARSTEARTRAISLLGNIEHPGKRAAIADAIAQTMDEGEAMVLLSYAAAPSGDVIARVLVDRLEHAAVSRLAVEGITDAFELEGAPLPKFRQAAFHQLLANPEAAHIRSCLQAVDHLRDRYGKPMTEPNHPDIDCASAWPTAAQPAWLALGHQPGKVA